MKKRTSGDFEKHIKGLIDKYSKILPVSHLKFDIKKMTEGDNDAYMQCASNYPYLDPTIYYSDRSLNDFIAGKDFEDIETSVVHEMIHPLTEPLYIKATQRYITHTDINHERERLTDLITHLVYKP